MVNLDGEQLEFKNKEILFAKLNSLHNIGKLVVFRPSNCDGFNRSSEFVPYHNGIFAQNSIKLAIRKYENPSLIKSISDLEVLV